MNFFSSPQRYHVYSDWPAPNKKNDAALNAERLRRRLQFVIEFVTVFETFETCYGVLRRYFETL